MKKFVWLLLIPLALMIGVGVGNAYRRFQRVRQTQEDIPIVEQKAQERLERFIDGIEVGEQFPDFPVWSPDGVRATNVLDLDTAGAVLALFSMGCESCVEDIAKLQDAWLAAGDNVVPLILLADDARNAIEVREKLREKGVQLPLWCDATRTLRDVHHVITRNAYFRLEPNGTLVAMRAWVSDPAGLLMMFLSEP